MLCARSTVLLSISLLDRRISETIVRDNEIPKVLIKRLIQYVTGNSNNFNTKTNTNTNATEININRNKYLLEKVQLLASNALNQEGVNIG